MEGKKEESLLPLLSSHLRRRGSFPFWHPPSLPPSLLTPFLFLLPENPPSLYHQEEPLIAEMGKGGQGGRDRKGKWRGESRRRRKEHFCSPFITTAIDCESFRRMYQVPHTPIFITQPLLSLPIHSDRIEEIECELRTLSSLMIFYWVSLFARRAESSGEQRGGGGKRGRQSEISRSREMGWAGDRGGGGERGAPSDPMGGRER